jgi:Iap family predicted aminopeptidase
VSARLEAAVSAAYLREVVERLESFRSHPLGFRAAGTEEERAAAGYVAGEMRGLGLRDVVEEPVPVDAWRLRDAYVELPDGSRYGCASMGGVPETPPGGVVGPLVLAGRAGRRQLDRLEVEDAVVLVDWRGQALWPYQSGLELGLRGAAAMIVTCSEGGPYYQAPGALGTMDGLWHPQGPPMVTIRKEDAAELAGKAGAPVRVVLDAPMAPAEAANVVGVLPGTRARAPLLVGGHHDGWFGGAFDDATGVAVTLALARAFLETGARLQHPVAFVSHTAEEFGIAWSRYDWCYGAWYQIVGEHRGWAARAPFYLNVEGSGLPASRFGADPPPELAGWTRRLLRRAARDGLLPYGWKLGSPDTWTEVWTFLAAGVPGVNVHTFTDAYDKAEYHTQYDTSESVDFDYLARITRVCARFLVEADEGGAGLLDYPARARHLRRSLRGVGHAGLERAMERLERARGREAFTAVGRGLHGLTAKEAAAYPHEQTARDVRRLEAALAALRAGDRRRAARELSRVGLNRLCGDLSREAFRLERASRGRRAPRACWAAQGDPDLGPDLWDELASLRREAGARAPGPWLERRLEGHLAASRRELERRLRRMERALNGRIPSVPRPRDLPAPAHVG